MLDPLDALCAEVDPDLFFPEDWGQFAQINDARRICSDCPIVLDCLREALEQDYVEGIWGGSTPKQRSRFKDNPLEIAIHLKKLRTRN